LFILGTRIVDEENEDMRFQVLTVLGEDCCLLGRDTLQPGRSKCIDISENPAACIIAVLDSCETITTPQGLGEDNMAILCRFQYHFYLGL
jgi:hypothetical protein